jgi:hypothetical protein
VGLVRGESPASSVITEGRKVRQRIKTYQESVDASTVRPTAYEDLIG